MAALPWSNNPSPQPWGGSEDGELFAGYPADFARACSRSAATPTAPSPPATSSKPHTIRPRADDLSRGRRDPAAPGEYLGGTDHPSRLQPGSAVERGAFRPAHGAHGGTPIGVPRGSAIFAGERFRGDSSFLRMRVGVGVRLKRWYGVGEVLPDPCPLPLVIPPTSPKPAPNR